MKRVIWNGKRYNFYPPAEGDDGPGRLVLLNDQRQETESIVTEFELNEVKELMMFDEDYVSLLRTENRQNRESLEALQKQLGDFKPEQIVELVTHLDEKKKEEDQLRQETMVKEGQWEQLLADTKREMQAQIDTANGTAGEAIKKYRNTVIRNTILNAASGPKVVENGAAQIVDLLSPFVGLGDDDAVVVFEDMGHQTKRLGSTGKPMTVVERVDVFLEDNQHYLKGHAGGAGSGGSGQKGQEQIDPKLPPVEKLKIARRQQAAGGS